MTGSDKGVVAASFVMLILMSFILQEPEASLPQERSTGLFDSHSIVFQTTLLTTSILLLASFVFGVIYEVIRYMSRSKIRQHGRLLTLLCLCVQS